MTTEDATKTAPAENQPRRWPKHAVWIGLVIAVGNFPLYFYFVETSPDLRDVPWINIPLSWLGLTLAVTGTWYVFKQKRGLLTKGLAATGLFLILFLVGLINWYVFSFSYTLPESSAATATGDVAPEVALLDHESQLINLSDYRGQNVVLVFYRGDW